MRAISTVALIRALGGGWDMPTKGSSARCPASARVLTRDALRVALRPGLVFTDTQRLSLPGSCGSFANPAMASVLREGRCVFIGFSLTDINPVLLRPLV